MPTFTVESFPNGEVSDDGTYVIVETRLTNGNMIDLKIPYTQFDWLQQAMLRLAAGAYERQIANGKIQPVLSVASDSAMTVETFSVRTETDTNRIRIQTGGRADPSEPMGMGSMIASEQAARDMGNALIEAADLLKSKKAPN
jgi:hypothetical protein